MDIRLARDEDWVAFRDLRLRALEDAPDAFGGTLDAAKDEPEPYWRGWITGEGWDGVVRSWVAEDRRRFRGMIVGVRFHADPSVANLFGMWVEPALRGSGVATRLVGMLEMWARGQGVDRIVLRVSDGNARAEAFYAKLGFTRTPRDPMPLRDGSPVRVHEMVRLLRDAAPLGVPSAERVGEP
jgi:GNAT superfamily N-acetyltransferase